MYKYFLIQIFRWKGCDEMATNIVVIGAPGAGKGTRIEEAKRVIPGLVSISTGDLIRRRGIDTSSGGLIQADQVIAILREELYNIKEKIVVFDGVPRTVEQAVLMEKYGIEIDYVIHLTLKEEVAIQRALDRLICPKCTETYTKSNFKPSKVQGICDKCGAKLTRRLDDNAETISKRMHVYRKETEPVLNWYKSKNIPIITVDSEEEPSVFVEVLKI